MEYVFCPAPQLLDFMKLLIGEAKDLFVQVKRILSF